VKEKVEFGELNCGTDREYAWPITDRLNFEYYRSFARKAGSIRGPTEESA